MCFRINSPVLLSLQGRKHSHPCAAILLLPANVFLTLILRLANPRPFSLRCAALREKWPCPQLADSQ